MADSIDWSGMLGGLANLWGAYQGSQDSANLNSTISGLLNNQQGAYNQQLQNLQQQIALGQAATQGQYNDARASVETQNAGLQNNVNYLTNVLTGLSDPNSIYMQGQNNALTRQDAMNGRRGNVEDRQVALDSKLAQYVAQYSPGLQQAINQASGLITNNNQGLANIYNTMSQSADRNNIALGNLLTGMNGAANTANTTQRQAANNATNSTTGLINSALGIGGNLLNSLFSSGGNNTGDFGGIYSGSGLWNNLGGGLGYDTGWGSTLGNVFNGSNGFLGDMPSYDTSISGYSGLGSGFGNYSTGYDTSGLGSWWS